MQQKGDIFLSKIRFSFFVIFFYMIGRGIPIPWVVPRESVMDKGLDFTTMIEDMMGSDPAVGSVLSLGLGPYVSTMLFVAIFSAIGSRGASQRLSPKIMRKITLIIAIFVGGLQAYITSGAMTYKESLLPLWFLRALTIMTLITGCFVVITLAEINKEKGFGGMKLLIMTNILTRVRSSFLLAYRKVMEEGRPDLSLILIFGSVFIFLVLITILFEKTELRLDIYRIMIHNDLSDVGYMAVKLNPSGTMPVMFAMTFFLIPTYLVKGLLLLFPDVAVLRWIEDNMNLTSVPGVLGYMLVVVALTYGFSAIFIDANRIAKQFEESGDCIAGVRPGKQTERTIRKSLRFCCFFSSLMQCGCVGIPLLMAAVRQDPSKLFTAPMSVIIVTGMSLTLIDEADVLLKFRDYKPFL